MPSDQTIQRIFEKLDELTTGQGDIKERLARVEEKQDSHYKENDNAHNTMAATIIGIQEQVKELEGGHDTQQSELDQRKGERKVLAKGWEFLIALVAGGVLVAVGGYIAKKIGIF